ncbi:hypothetical protein BT69DRAFT_1277371, partial [Atractiella rhizophila]
RRSWGATLSSRRGSKPRFSRSKKGCLICIQRGVKCGEEKPGYANCGRPSTLSPVHPTKLSWPSASQAVVATLLPQDHNLSSSPASSGPQSPPTDFHWLPTPPALMSERPILRQPGSSPEPSSSLRQSTTEDHKQRAVFPGEYPVQLSAQDANLIRYFLDVLVPTSKAIDPHQPNFFLSLFGASLFCAPLYDGHQRSLTLLRYPWDSSAVSFSVDLILPTLVTYALWEISNGTTSQAMNLVFDMSQDVLASTNHTFATLTPTTQSCAIILTHLCLSSSSFGAKEPKFAYWLLQSTFEPSIGDSFVATVPNAYVEWLHLYPFAAQASMLDHELQSLHSSLAPVQQVDMIIQRGEAILQALILSKRELDKVLTLTLTPELLDLLHQSVFFNSLVISLSRLIHIRPANHYSSNIITTASRIAQCGVDPLHIFPRCLVFAGLEAQNPQDYHWVSTCFDQMASARWICAKPKQLMNEIHEEEMKSGTIQLTENILQSEYYVVL